MIISASRRTDIPAFYSGWFFNRLAERYVLVANPFNTKSVSRINLDPAAVDCIVFWTKNPEPMIGDLHRLADYEYYFQFTLNGYGSAIECRLPPLSQRVETFRRLSDVVGKERVVWRYDPVFINERYNSEFHRDTFAAIACALGGYTETCMIGFIDHYRHLRRTLSERGISTILQSEAERVALSCKEAADRYGIGIKMCTSKMDLTRSGVPAGSCIDKDLVERLAGYPLAVGRDRNQREVCACAESVDIGAYGTCRNGCIYCYAMRGGHGAHMLTHDDSSPLLGGCLQGDETIRERVMKPLRDDQRKLF